VIPGSSHYNYSTLSRPGSPIPATDAQKQNAALLARRRVD
jgi:hypothetical protein